MPFIAQGHVWYYSVVVVVLFSSGDLVEIRFTLKKYTERSLKFLSTKFSRVACWKVRCKLISVPIGQEKGLVEHMNV